MKAPRIRSLRPWISALGALAYLATVPAAQPSNPSSSDSSRAVGISHAPLEPGRKKKHSPYLAAQHLDHADIGNALQWGVDSMQAHQTNAGNLIRFSYRVVDVDKAKVLIDKSANPMMISARANVALQIPVMDKVGPLRQSTELEPGKVYWMAFSNKGNLVRPGDHVSVLVGTFRVDGLIVQ